MSAEPDVLVARIGPHLCSRCNCLYDKVLLFVEPVFTMPGGDSQEMGLSGLATLAINVCCGHIKPIAISPERVLRTIEHMKDCPNHDD